MKDLQTPTNTKTASKKWLWIDIVTGTAFLVGYMILLGHRKENWIGYVWLLSIPTVIIAIVLRQKGRSGSPISSQAWTLLIGIAGLALLFVLVASGAGSIVGVIWKIAIAVGALYILAKLARSLKSQHSFSLKGMSIRNKVLTGLIVLAVIGLIGSHFDKSGTGPGTGAPHQSPFDHSVDIVERYIKHDYLRDPGSYESIRWSKLEKNADGTFQVTHEFRAKNGFGGMGSEIKTFTISTDGTRVIGVD